MFSGRPAFRLLRLRDSAWFAQDFPVTAPMCELYHISRGSCSASGGFNQKAAFAIIPL